MRGKFSIFNFQFSIKFLLLLFAFSFLLTLSPNPYTLNPTFAQTTSCTTTTPRVIDGLVSTPQQSLSSKFGTSSGTCVVNSKASFVPFKIPGYDDLKSIYYTQSKATKILLNGDATQTNLNFTTDSVYYITGNLNLSGNPPATAVKTGVVFVDGNLNITANYTYGTPTTGTVFVVNGNVNIFYTPTLVTQVNAVIISQGTICTAYDAISFSCPALNVQTSQLIINGSLISTNELTPIKFRRTLDPLAAINNTNNPAEIINHQIKYLVTLKEIFSSTVQKWAEVPGGPITTPPSPTPTPTPTPTASPTPAPTCTPANWYQDADGDTYGNPTVTASSCTQPPGYVADNTDCYDSSNLVHPNQTQCFSTTYNGISYDYDCSGANNPCGGNLGGTVAYTNIYSTKVNSTTCSGFLGTNSYSTTRAATGTDCGQPSVRSISNYYYFNGLCNGPIISPPNVGGGPAITCK